MAAPASPRPAQRRAALVAIAVLAAVGAAWPSAAAAQDEDAAPARPRYLLQRPDGRAVTPDDFRGRFQLVTFGFTSCPDVCPTTLLDLQQVLRELGPRAARLQAIFVTVDPQRDSAVVLKAYTEAFDARILGLGGPEALVRRAADAFKVRYEKVQEPGAAPDVYTMDHSAGLYLLGPDGQWLQRFVHGAPVAEIVTRLEAWMDRLR